VQIINYLLRADSMNYSDLGWEEWLDYDPVWPSTNQSSVGLRVGASMPPDTERSPEGSPLAEERTTSSSPSPPPELLEETPAENLDLPEHSTSGRLRARCLLLTYSQTIFLDKERIASHLRSIGPVESLRVGQESHKDGGVHFHAYVLYRKNLDRSPNAFDVLDHHPNIRTANAKMGTLAQSMVNMWNYVGKEDPNPLQDGPPPQAAKRTRAAIYLDAIQISQREGVEAAMTMLQMESPFEVATRYDSIQRSLTSVRNKKVRTDTAARPLETFLRQLPVPDEWRTLFIWGKSGVGKTQYARALLPEASVIRHRNQLMDADFSKGIIFDDFDVSHWPPTAVIHLLDWDERSGIDVKHGHAMIPPHTKRIFTYNNDPCHWYPPGCSPEQVAAILRRMHVIEINTKLFNYFA